MKPLSQDTNSKAEKVLIELLRQAPVYKHLEIVSSLIKTTWQLSWQGICLRYPKEKPEALARSFFLLLYPDLPLPDQFERFLLP
jgi:hypothetical protein